MLTVGIHGETPLNSEFGIDNKRQDYKISTVCGQVLVSGVRVNRVYYGETIWLMGFMYT
jgi:hypothetical protein